MNTFEGSTAKLDVILSTQTSVINEAWSANGVNDAEDLKASKRAVAFRQENDVPLDYTQSIAAYLDLTKEAGHLADTVATRSHSRDEDVDLQTRAEQLLARMDESIEVVFAGAIQILTRCREEADAKMKEDKRYKSAESFRSGYKSRLLEGSADSQHGATFDETLFQLDDYESDDDGEDIATATRINYIPGDEAKLDDDIQTAEGRKVKLENASGKMRDGALRTKFEACSSENNDTARRKVYNAKSWPKFWRKSRRQAVGLMASVLSLDGPSPVIVFAGEHRSRDGSDGRGDADPSSDELPAGLANKSYDYLASIGMRISAIQERLGTVSAEQTLELATTSAGITTSNRKVKRDAFAEEFLALKDLHFCLTDPLWRAVHRASQTSHFPTTLWDELRSHSIASSQ